MAGATGSNQDLVVGRTNHSDGRTTLWAKVPPGQANFNGPAILIVETAKNAVDPDDYEDGSSFVPSNNFHGILAAGWSGGGPGNFGGTPGASGVIGRGGRNRGTGVVGLGGGVPDPGSNGAGGIGVHGLGGSQVDLFPDPSTSPGAGMIGQGGRQTDKSNTLRLPHAAGVIGIGGGTGLKTDFLTAHTLMETGSVGVYAQGAEATVTMVPPQDESGTIPGPDVPSGPLAPGAGVLGRGGVPIPPEGPVAAGVIGLAGGEAIPSISETGNNGVFGDGPVGVFGQGVSSGVRGKSKSQQGDGVFGETDSGIGVRGSAGGDQGRAGAFQSKRSAQIWLIPQEKGADTPTLVNVTPKAIETERGGPKLPRDGRGGDLLSAIDIQGECTLWFCVKGGNGEPAEWAQVLLGPSFDGED